MPTPTQEEMHIDEMIAYDVEPYTEETLEELYIRTGIEPGFLTELTRES